MTGAATIACTNCGKRNRMPLGGHGFRNAASCHTALTTAPTASP